MDAGFILTAYLTIFTAWLITELGLETLNLSYVRAHARSVPPTFAGSIDDETWAKSQSYTLAKGKFALFATAWSALWTILFVSSGWFGAVDDWLGSFLGGHRYVHGVAFIFLISFLFFICELPFALYRTFVIEERFGFNRMTLALWTKDVIKGAAINFIVGAPLLALIFWFIDFTGANWWLYAFLAMSTVQILLFYLYPVLISPLFNTFTPLPEGSLRDAILRLAERTGFRMSGVFVMDGSRRSAHGNAYFTGFGKNKRIVLFDTLVNKLKDEETAAVLAHEIGHEKKKHVIKGLVFSLVIELLAFYVLSLLIATPAFYDAFGFTKPNAHAALVIFMFAASPVIFFLTPIVSLLARRFEYQADRFAAAAVEGWKPLGNALLTLHKASLSNFTPHPLYSFFHYSHPTLAERLEALRRTGEERATAR